LTARKKVTRSSARPGKVTDQTIDEHAAAESAAPVGSASAPKKPSKAKQLRIAFFGGREPGELWLEALAAAGFVPSLIVDRPPPERAEASGPDDASERDGSTQRRQSAVAPWAQRRGVELLTSVQLPTEALVARMKALEIDLGIVGGFGRELEEEVLAVPRLGCIGVHGSQLPRLRVPNPVRMAILEGERETGATIYRLTAPSQEDEGNDLGGPVLLQEAIAIEDRETYGELLERVAAAGAGLLVQAVLALEQGRPRLQERKQDPKRVSETTEVTSRHLQAPWWLPADGVFQRLRAFAPDEGLTSMLKRRGIEILWGVPIDWESAPFGVTGTYLGMRQGRMAVLCGHGTVFGIDRVRWRDDDEVQCSFDFVYAQKLRPGERFA
jgi:methionyl-tRNA formyltransferase